MLGYFEIRIMKLLGSSTPTKYQLPTCIGLINIHIPKLFYSKPRKSLTLSLFLFGSGRDTSLKKWVLMEALELCPWLEFLFCFFSSSSIWCEAYLSSSSSSLISMNCEANPKHILAESLLTETIEMPRN